MRADMEESLCEVLGKRLSARVPWMIADIVDEVLPHFPQAKADEVISTLIHALKNPGPSLGSWVRERAISTSTTPRPQRVKL